MYSRFKHMKFMFHKNQLNNLIWARNGISGGGRRDAAHWHLGQSRTGGNSLWVVWSLSWGGNGIIFFDFKYLFIVCLARCGAGEIEKLRRLFGSRDRERLLALFLEGAAAFVSVLSVPFTKENIYLMFPLYTHLNHFNLEPNQIVLHSWFKLMLTRP